MDGKRIKSWIFLSFLVFFPALLSPLPSRAGKSPCSLNVRLNEAPGIPASPVYQVRAVGKGGILSTIEKPNNNGFYFFENISCKTVRVEAIFPEFKKTDPVIHVMTMEYANFSQITDQELTLMVPILRPVRITVIDSDGHPVKYGVAKINPKMNRENELPITAWVPINRNGQVEIFLHPGKYQAFLDSSRDEMELRPIRASLNGSSVPSYPITKIHDSNPKIETKKPFVQIVMVENIGLKFSIVNDPVEITFQLPESKRFPLTGKLIGNNNFSFNPLFLEITNPKGQSLLIPIDRNGYFRAIVNEFPLSFSLYDQSHLFRLKPDSTSLKSPSTAEIPLVLEKIPQQIVSGKIVDKFTGKGIANVQIQFSWFCFPNENNDNSSQKDCSALEFSASHSDDMGNFSAPCHAGIPLSINPDHPDFQYHEFIYKKEQSCNEDIFIEMSPQTKISGKVSDRIGIPVPDAGIQFSVPGDAWFKGEFFTDEKGRYQTTILPDFDYQAVLDPHISPAHRPFFLANGKKTSSVYSQFRFSKKQKVKMDLQLLPGGQICPLVKTSKGTPIAEFSIKIAPISHSYELNGVVQSFWGSEYYSNFGCTWTVPPGSYSSSSTATFSKVLSEHLPLYAWPMNIFISEMQGSVVVREGEKSVVEITRDEPAGTEILARLNSGWHPSSTPFRLEISSVESIQTPYDSEDGIADWFPVPRERIYFYAHDDMYPGKAKVESVAISAPPVGLYHLRVCIGKRGCEGDSVWQTRAPILVEEGKMIDTWLFPD